VARRLVREYQGHRAAVARQRAVLAERRTTIRPWTAIDAPEGGKEELLTLEQGLEEGQRRESAVFNAVLTTLAEALAFEPDNVEVRRELGEFHYLHMAEAERARRE